MKKRIRIGNDIHILWWMTFNGGNTSLEELPLTVELKDPVGRVIVMQFTIGDGCLEFDFFGKDQRHTGDYTLTCWVCRGEVGQAVIDKCEAFTLVSHTCEEHNIFEGFTNKHSLEFFTKVAIAQKGVTPHIGDNKNWWIGNDDTGIRAEGLDYVLTEEDRREFTQPAVDKANEVEGRMVIVEQRASELDNDMTEALGKSAQATQEAKDAAKSVEEVIVKSEHATDNANESAHKADVATDNANAKMAEFDAQEAERQQEELTRKTKETERETAEVTRSQSEALREEAEIARRVVFNISQHEREAQFSASNAVWEDKVNNVVAEVENAVREAENAKQTVISSLDKYIGSPISDVTVIL